jgi:CHAT domain-containing protein
MDIPLDFRDFVGSGGRISLYSGAGISIAANQQGTPSVLDGNSAYAPFPGQINLLNDSTTHPLALGPGTVLTATTAPGGFAGSTMLISSQGGLTLDGVSADTSGGSGGQITMAAKGGLSIASSQFTSTGSDPTSSPSTQLISLDGSPPVITNDTLFTPDHATIIAAQSSDQLSPEDGSIFDLAAQQVQSLTDTLAYTYANGSEVFLENGPVSRSTWLSALLDQGRAPDFDLIIDNRDPNNFIITRIDQSKSISSRLATTSRQVDLANPEDVAALRSLLGEEVFNTVIWNPGEGSSGADLLANATPANVRQATGELTGQGNLEPARRAGDSATSEAPTPTLAVRPADALDPKRALESLDAGELTSLQAVSQALGLTANLAKPPTILELQGYIKAAIEAIRQRQKSQAWNQGGSEAARIASVSTDQLLSAKASFDPVHYKPAILRYSFSARPAAPAPSSEGAKPPAMGLIDIVLVLPEGAPKGWRVEVPIARLREALAQHYANMASMGPLPSGAPAATPAASQLAQLLLEPVQATLKANDVTSLIISSDLNLIDVPYASLPLEGGFLGDRYAITITPSLALTSLTSTDKPPRYEKGTLIRAGASTFANGLAPLPMVEQELTTIAREDGGTVLLNQDFNAIRLLKVLEDPEVKRIHIASHAELKPGNETDARIYTSSSSVGLKELGELRQRSGGQSLDLVSLSACRSAVSGSELELGFAGMAIQLGAKSAIGTKWYVDDVATSSFFVQFYRYLDQGIPKAEAIQLTQKDFLSGRVRVQEDRVVGSGGSTLVTGLSPDQQRRYATGFSHPYFWAAVQLVGSPW